MRKKDANPKDSCPPPDPHGSLRAFRQTRKVMPPPSCVIGEKKNRAKYNRKRDGLRGEMGEI